ncbi:MAG: [protein-PII] uridylyltransferase [Deltaproteobacteria bacterium]
MELQTTLVAVPEVPADDRAAALARLPAAPGEDVKGYWTRVRQLVRGVHASGVSGRTVVRLGTEAMDRLIRALAERAGLDAKRVALVAQGGYGRRELTPGSDVDLLALYDGPAPALDTVLYPLWDLRLELGHAARTPAEALRFAEEDPVGLSALLDARLLWGSRRLFEGVERGLSERLQGQRGEAYILAKRDELVARRSRYGASVFLLEPNVKQCEGGLRDLQTAVWMARVRYRVSGLRQLLAASVLPPSSVAGAMRARDFLWRVRAELHLGAGRKEDQLTFDRQLEVARALGYRDSREGLAVEQLMRHYYLAAAACKRIADEIVERCLEARGAKRPQETPIDHELKLWGSQLTVTERSVFEVDPTAIARAFLAAGRLGVPLYSYARDLVAQELPRVDEQVRADPRATLALRELFSLEDTDGAWLTQMHELGALTAFLPELGRVTALAQHDVYHVYTVDVHLVRALRRLYALRRGDLVREEPELTRLCLQARAWLPLCLGVLFHDSGKGQGGQHSERGAELVRSAGGRLGLSPHELGLAEFLVREHLTLSHVAQRRDLADPETIERFAAQMGTAERLELLYLLTYVDVSSVGPSTWTDWKARLFRELYQKSREQLEGTRRRRPAGERLRRGLARLGLSPHELELFLGRMPERYLRSVRARGALRHRRLLERLSGRPLAAQRVRRGHATELVLAARDRPGLLALFAGALAAHRITILSAEVYSSSAGEALDVFLVQAADGGPLPLERWRAARADLRRVLGGAESPQALLARRIRVSPLLRHPLPAVETKIRIDNDAAQRATVIDVQAEDRLGLLFTLARSLHELGLEISLAKVMTEANRAVDSFYVTKGGEKLADPVEWLRIERELKAALAP